MPKSVRKHLPNATECMPTACLWTYRFRYAVSKGLSNACRHSLPLAKSGTNREIRTMCSTLHRHRRRQPFQDLSVASSRDLSGTTLSSFSHGYSLLPPPPKSRNDHPNCCISCQTKCRPHRRFLEQGRDFRPAHKTNR